MGTLTSPILAAIAAFLITFGLRFGVTISDETAMGIVVLLQRVLEKLFARFFNPADVADPILKKEGIIQADSLRGRPRI